MDWDSCARNRFLFSDYTMGPKLKKTSEPPTKGVITQNKKRAQQLRCALMRQRVMPSTKNTPTLSQSGSDQQPQQPAIKHNGKGTDMNESTKPGNKSRVGFSTGTCTKNADHPSLLHICSYCLDLYSAASVPSHGKVLQEKKLAKNGAGGV